MQRGIPNVSLYVYSSVRLNGHRYSPLYDSTFDLARVDWRHWRHNSWIMLHDTCHEPRQKSSEDAVRLPQWGDFSYSDSV